jgi:hypothetical protein
MSNATSPSVAGLGSVALLVSAIVGAIGVVFITLMYAAFGIGATAAAMTFGWINDVAVMVQYLLAVPGVLAIGAALRPGSPRLARPGTWLALAGIAVIVALQALLVAGVLTFAQEIGPASLGFLVLGAWMVAAAIVGRRMGTGPTGPGTALLAAFYMGYPLWAFRVSRWMATTAAGRGVVAASTVDAT